MDLYAGTLEAAPTDRDPTPAGEAPPAASPRRILSGAAGRYPALGELANQVCLVEQDGKLTLFMVEGRSLDHDVASYEDDLSRLGALYDVHECTYAELVEVRESGAHQVVEEAISGRARTVQTEDAEMQREIMRHFQQAVELRASDLHYMVDDHEGFSVSPRVNGDIEAALAGGASAAAGKRLIQSLYNSMLDAGDEHLREREAQDGRLKQVLAARAGLFGARVATHPTVSGILVAVRLLYDAGANLRSLGQLGYLPEQQAILTPLTKRSIGSFNVVAGPTGSGKSTTLQVAMSMLIEHFQGTRNVLTLEDPVEYKIRGARQMPVLHQDVSESQAWLNGIKSAMRLDPDVIMIGEIRDEASATAAIRAAITGHAVWSTVHANDAASALQRLADLGVEPTLLFDPSTITSLTGTALVAVVCPKCRTPWKNAVHAQEVGLVERVERYCHGSLDGVFVRGPGCEACRHTGLMNRTALAETIAPSREFMRLFQSQGKAEATAYWLSREGGISKAKHLLQRIREGVIDPAMGEAHIGSIDKDDMFLREVQP